MEILADRNRFGWEISRQIDELDKDKQRRFVDLEWFGVEVSWRDDAALFAGDLDIKIWDECCLHSRNNKILISPFRLRLEDEDLVEEIAEQVEAAWDRARGLRAYDLGLDK